MIIMKYRLLKCYAYDTLIKSKLCYVEVLTTSNYLATMKDSVEYEKVTNTQRNKLFKYLLSSLEILKYKNN